ncbi:hypothetical protein [Thalassotalea piscium]|uniref:Lipoprotein n=1 Tax=Thalassotalea piscium TaxID=1230533 RepID=A0A7X0NGR4_9GAMM|nr:hypothetical protein [Thalassotalea piscium]MBB6543109.1 hypothetical protein [Thalassotalea piscium]
MKTLISTTLCALLLLTGCLSTPHSIEREFNQKNISTSVISPAEHLSLTYRFKENLIAEEQEAFYDYLGTPQAVEYLSPKLNEAIGATGAFSKAVYQHSNLWSDALRSGQFINTLGIATIAGATFALLTPSKTRHKSSYKYYLQDYTALTPEEVTQRERDKTINFTNSFFKKHGYKVVCAQGCNADRQPDKSGKYVFNYYLENSQLTSYYKSNFIQVQFILNPLIKVVDNEDAAILGSPYNYESDGIHGWRVWAEIPVSGDTPKDLKRLPNGDEIGHTGCVGCFAGTTMYFDFYKGITKALKGYSHYEYSFHHRFAFYDGHSYELNEELTNHSIIKSILNN